MKTILYTALLMLIVSVSACKKEDPIYTCKITCDECVKDGFATTVCAEDFGDNEAYNAAISAYGVQGFNCTRSTANTETADSDDERRDLEDEGYVCTAD